ncbi:tryptophan 7-halogenase [Hirschia litorea]|uniref:Tryptophan 7-halogenase n=1 Tax=Hirschia litorea TaxID=1199156 RepID=A0ABW2IPE9_9PROT
MSTLIKINLLGNCHLTWYLALRLRTALSFSTHQIEVSPQNIDDNNIPPAFTLRPEMLRVLEEIDLTEQELFATCDANFLLGVQYRYSRNNISDFTNCFSKTGISANGTAFHHYWAKLKHANLAKPYWMYSLGAALSEKCKFYHPSDNPRSINSTFSYGYTVNALKFRNVLKKLCLSNGVTIKPNEATLDMPTWEINCSQSIPATGVNYQATSIQRTKTKPIATLTLNPDTIKNTAYTTCHEFVETHPLLPRDTNKSTPAVWTGKTIDLGGVLKKYSGFQSTNFTVIETACETFLSTLHSPLDKNDSLIRAFNNVVSDTIENTDLFLELHLLENQPPSQVPWEKKASPKLQRKIEQFRRRGRVVMYDNETYSDDDWITSMLSLGIIPETSSIGAQAAPTNALNAFYSKHYDRIQKQATAAPTLNEYLDHLLENSKAEQIT